jgi:DNA-binding NtrC family response regulator
MNMKKTVLLIEDRSSHSDAFIVVAKALDCDIEVVNCVESLRRVIGSHPFGGWDLIVMDCQMPERPAGQPTTQYMEEMYELIWPKVQKGALWIWSVLSDVEDVARFLEEHNLNQYTIAKGQTPERLAKSLKQALCLEG